MWQDCSYESDDVILARSGILKVEEEHQNIKIVYSFVDWCKQFLKWLLPLSTQPPTHPWFFASSKNFFSHSANLFFAKKYIISSANFLSHCNFILTFPSFSNNQILTFIFKIDPLRPLKFNFNANNNLNLKNQTIFGIFLLLLF